MDFRNMEKAYRKRQANINPETMWYKNYYGNPKRGNALCNASVMSPYNDLRSMFCLKYIRLFMQQYLEPSSHVLKTVKQSYN